MHACEEYAPLMVRVLKSLLGRCLTCFLDTVENQISLPHDEIIYLLRQFCNILVALLTSRIGRHGQHHYWLGFATIVVLVLLPGWLWALPLPGVLIAILY
jgi:hypothetical protein